MRLLFLCYLFMEICVSYQVTDIIGVFGIFAETILSAFLGFVILINFRFILIESFMRLRNERVSEQRFITSNILRVIGAILLILPGVLTDILGILMQFSSVGFIIAKPFLNRLHFQGRDDHYKYTYEKSEIIDAEIIDKDK